MGVSSSKGKKVQKRGSGGFDPKIKDLQCFLNQPNINMVLPWLYEIYKNIVKPDSSKQQKQKRGEEDPVLKDLECFFNQPNINMAIPWIYEIRNAVKEGGGGGGIEWEDETRSNNDDIVMEEG